MAVDVPQNVRKSVAQKVAPAKSEADVVETPAKTTPVNNFAGTDVFAGKSDQGMANNFVGVDGDDVFAGFREDVATQNFAVEENKERWRVEWRSYTRKKDGVTTYYYNYRARWGYTCPETGKRKVPYRKGGKNVRKQIPTN